MKRLHFLPAVLLVILLLAVISGSVPLPTRASSSLPAVVPVTVSVRPVTSEICSDDIAAWLLLAARSAGDAWETEAEKVTIGYCSQ